MDANWTRPETNSSNFSIDATITIASASVKSGEKKSLTLNCYNGTTNHVLCEDVDQNEWFLTG